jgi:type I restriction enzyme S subunit
MTAYPLESLRSLSSVITKGTTPKTLGKAYAKDGIPFLRGEDIRGFAVNWENVALHIDEETSSILSRSVIKHGDLLITIAGTIGRCGFVGADAPLMNCNQAVAIIRLNYKKVDLEYACFACQSSDVVQSLAQQRTTATISNLSLQQIGDIQIPLPPLDEQRRIVDILNHAASIRRLRDEARAKAREVIPALFVEMFGDPATNPKGWEVNKLSEMVSFISGATPSKQEPRFWGMGTPWVSAKDMKADPIVSAEDLVTAAAFDESNLKLIPANSILIVVRGMILAHTVPIRVNAIPVAINQDLKALRPRNAVHHQFLRWCLQCLHPHLLSKVSNAAHGTTKLDMDVMFNLEIPVPPITIQHEFAERVAEVEAISTLNDKAVVAAEQLAQSLMSQVFGSSS